MAARYRSRAVGGDLPIEHVVVIVKENHTYDNYFADFRKEVAPSSNPVRCTPWRTVQCNPGHEQALIGPGPGPGCRCRYSESDLPNYWRYARAFTLAERCFSEVLGPSVPNHLMLMAGRSPVIDNFSPIPDLVTVADRVEERSLTWRNYRGGPNAGLAMIARVADHPSQAPWQRFAADAREGNLPHLAWVTPPFCWSEHPPAPPAWGEAWTVRQVNAVMSGPLWPRSAIFVLWDDWGGLADHVEPPVVERWDDGTPFRYGYRTPLLVISPLVRPGYLYRRTCSFVSIPAFLASLFGLEPLTFRDKHANTLMDCFDFAQEPLPPLILPARAGLPERVLCPFLNRLAGWFD